jgi:hypothetical protein
VDEVRRALAVLLLLGATGCGTFRAGEATIAQSKAIRVRLVRYYENVPFDYTGYKYDVECIAPSARITLGTSTEFANYNDNSPRRLAERLRTRVTITGDDVAIWVEQGSIAFAFDGCGTVRDWRAPQDVFDLPGETIRVRDLHAGADGAISFVVESDRGHALRVTSSDAGEHWHQERMK